jgi:hypothetical protein
MTDFKLLTFSGKLRLILMVIICIIPSLVLYGFCILGKWAEVLADFLQDMGRRFIRYEWETEQEKEWRNPANWDHND